MDISIILHNINVLYEHYVNCARTTEMKMWSSQLQLRFKQSQSKPKKCFQGFNGIRTHGLCGQFIEFIVYVKGLKYMNTMCKLQTYQWNEDELKWNEANAEAMGSNPVEAPKTFFGFTLRLLKSQLQLQWSHLHLWPHTGKRTLTF